MSKRSVEKYGFIGLGNQGAPIARRMAEAGLPVILSDRRAEALAAFADTSAEVASSIAELGRQANYVAVCVVDDAGVQEVCDELIAVMSAGGCIVIHSTVHPELCKSLAQKAAERGLHLVDAPVSGGGGGAAAGSLTVMLGGDQASVETIKPVLETFAGLIVHLGPVGAGQNAKLINNAMMAAHVAIAHQGLEAAADLGINQEAFIELVKVSSGRSFGFEVRARMVSPSSFEHGARLLEKDVRLLGDALGSDPSFNTLRELTGKFFALALKHQQQG